MVVCEKKAIFVVKHMSLMSDINDFFSFRNRVGDISEEDQKQAVNYLESIDAFARTTYKSLYVIDYKEKGFDYVSENPLFLCGNTAEEVKKWDMPSTLNML